MASDDWSTEELTGPPEAALTADGHPVTVTGGTWQDATDDLHDTIRRADDLRRLFGDAAEAAGDLEEEA